MAAELVGGALLSAFLQVAFDRLASTQFVDFFRGRKLDDKLLRNLNIMLHSVNALADDAEQKQFTDPHRLSSMQKISWMKLIMKSPDAKWKLNQNLKPSFTRYQTSSMLLSDHLTGKLTQG
ncbi:hypothetical protein V8G54_011170 [Vigna mungo]|uniref:Disease resistance RPP13-like protein 1 n=1 Tax=Vigna mungo TaxID=3915 RepID=A0AAQ3NNK9_VIGMU